MKRESIDLANTPVDLIKFKLKYLVSEFNEEAPLEELLDLYVTGVNHEICKKMCDDVQVRLLGFILIIEYIATTIFAIDIGGFTYFFIRHRLKDIINNLMINLEIMTKNIS